MLITDQFSWDRVTFESYIEGMCEQIRAFPHERVAFWAEAYVEVILTLFAIWKVGKIACPLSPRLPKAPLEELKTSLFTPQFPQPITPTPTAWRLDQLGALLFTSGSMGAPKIAQLTLSNLVYSAEGSNRLIPLEPKETWGLTLPLYHVGGLGILLRSYLAGSFVSLNYKQASLLSLVPTQLYRLLKEPQEVPHLKTILLGGAPLPSIATPWEVIPTYGMTEMSSQIVTGNRLHPYAEMKIEKDHEIYVRGKVLFQGYLGHAPVEGWFATGDLGKWEDGFQILGRKDNMFISGGENIQPEEIEALFQTVCHVPEAIVIPLADPEFGHRPAVFLNDPTTLPHLQKILENHLPKYKIPIKAFKLPRLNGLKPNRKALHLSLLSL